MSKIPTNTIHQIVDFVNKILSKKKLNTKENTKDLEERIDKLVYELYELTPEEIQIIEDQSR